jgi:hypothetical protein
MTLGVDSAQAAAPPAVHPLAVLDDAERLFSSDLLGALAADQPAGERHRRDLVLQALAAYERLRLGQAPDSDPATVFGRWPTVGRRPGPHTRCYAITPTFPG